MSRDLALTERQHQLRSSAGRLPARGDLADLQLLPASRHCERTPEHVNDRGHWRGFLSS